MNKNLVSFLIFVVGLAVFHKYFSFFTPKEVGWFLTDTLLFFVCSVSIITHLMLRVEPRYP
ncbi:MAG: hypothetical protein Ct9H300mP23_02790 [Nitrospinota bacterium]|nr:MAG: hypothetical protein Ct9H300mP23_02790 [Nitrospinota bacterium]